MTTLGRPEGAKATGARLRRVLSSDRRIRSTSEGPAGATAAGAGAAGIGAEGVWDDSRAVG